MKTYNLSNSESAAGGFTHLVVVTYADFISQTTANTAQAKDTLSLAVGDVIRGSAIKLVTPFQKSGTTAFNTNTVTIGDSGSATRYFSSTELNANGSYIPYAHSTNAYTYTTANALRVTLAAMSGYSLSQLDTGELHIFLQIAQLPKLSQ